MAKEEQFIKVIVWGEDWLNDTYLEISDEKPFQYWVSLPKSIQTEILDKLIEQLIKIYPEAIIIDTGFKINLPKDYTPIDPKQEFDNRLSCLYSNKFF